MLKNRTLIGIVLIVIAIGICFGISPLFSKLLDSKTNIVRLKNDVEQGTQITRGMLEVVEVGTLNVPENTITDPTLIVGKYTVTAMFKGDTFITEKLTYVVDNSDSLLRQLEPNETAMSVTIRSFANGLSGKLQQGDIIQIVSVDDDDDTATVYDELQYVEVLTTTASNGSDDVYQDGKVNEGATDDGDDEENELYATVTVVLQDRAQALRLAECENTSLHAVFICRGNDELKEECLKAQLEVLGGVSEDIPDEETEDISDSVIPTVPNIDDLVDVESEETDGE